MAPLSYSPSLFRMTSVADRPARYIGRLAEPGMMNHLRSHRPPRAYFWMTVIVGPDVSSHASMSKMTGSIGNRRACVALGARVGAVESRGEWSCVYKRIAALMGPFRHIEVFFKLIYGTFRQCILLRSLESLDRAFCYSRKPWETSSRPQSLRSFCASHQ